MPSPRPSLSIQPSPRLRRYAPLALITALAVLAGRETLLPATAEPVACQVAPTDLSKPMPEYFLPITTR